MPDLAGWLALVNLFVIVFGSLGSIFAFRSGKANAERAAQQSIREMIREENELLQARVKRLETSNQRMNKMLQLIVSTLKKTHGIELKIDEDILSVRDASGGTHTAQIDNSGT